MSGTGIDVPNLPKCPVPVLISYRYLTGTGTGTGQDLGIYKGGICTEHIILLYPAFHGGTCVDSSLYYAVYKVPFGLSTEKKVQKTKTESP